MNDLSNEIAARLDIKPTALESYWRAANYMGYQHPHVDQALQILTRRLKEALSGDESRERMFAKHGIQITNQPESVIENCLRLIDNNAPMPERVAAAADLFGDEHRVMLKVAAAWNKNVSEH